MLDSLPHRRARRITLMTLALMLWALMVMLVLKLLVGWSTNSLALIATALHTLLTVFMTLLSLQSCRFAQPLRQPPLRYGRFELGTVFLFWALLGSGAGVLLLMLLQRWQGGLGATLFSLPLIQLVGLMGLVGLCFAFVDRYVARQTGSALLASNALLVLQEAWLNLLVLCSLLLLRYGYDGVDSLLALVMVPLTIVNSWRWLKRQLPQLFHVQAVAPEAIAHIAQQMDGVLRCIPLRSEGLVGRQLSIDLQLVVHPEYADMTGVIRRQVEASLRQHYGPVEVNLELLNPQGKRLRSQVPPPANRQTLDFLDWN